MAYIFLLVLYIDYYTFFVSNPAKYVVFNIKENRNYEVIFFLKKEKNLIILYPFLPADKISKGLDFPQSDNMHNKKSNGCW